MTEREVLAAIRKKYADNEWALMKQVRDDVGFNGKRTADAVAMNMWPSRGLTVIGFEIKCSRSDWLRELRRPDKAESIQPYCDGWYLVTADATMAQEGEIPAAWGWAVVHRGSLRNLKPAPVLEPKPLDRGFIAGVLRRASKEMEFAPDNAPFIEQGRQMEREHWQERVDQTNRHYNELSDKVRAFEQASGIRLSTLWEDGAKIGKAVRWVLDGGNDRGVADLEAIARAGDTVAQRSRETIETLRTGLAAAHKEGVMDVQQEQLFYERQGYIKGMGSTYWRPIRGPHLHGWRWHEGRWELVAMQSGSMTTGAGIRVNNCRGTGRGECLRHRPKKPPYRAAAHKEGEPK